MKRIASSNVAEDLFGPGKDGFQPGNPAINLFPTFLTDDWCNDLQEEPMNVIEASGQAENGASRTQLLEAIRRIAARKLAVATTASTGPLGLADSGLVVCDASGGNVSLTLPAANAALRGTTYRFMRIDSSGNTVTVSCAGSNNFHGGATSITVSVGDLLEVVGDGTSEWFVVASSGGGLRPGDWKWTTGSTPGPGFLAPNGSLLNRADYPGLWAYAQTSGNIVSDAAWAAGQFGSYSTGNGSTTFRIPDVRGDVFRVLDAGRGVDTGRVLGSFQNHAIQDHTHVIGGMPNWDAFASRDGNVPYATDNFGATVGTSGAAGANVASETRMRNTAYNVFLRY